MASEFEPQRPGPGGPRAIHREEDLRRLLERVDGLHRDLDRLRTEAHPLATVDDVAEALGLDPEAVAEEWERVRAEAQLERLAKNLRDLEEPLYRVERPSPETGVLGTDPLMRLRVVHTLMDRATVRPALVRRYRARPEDEAASRRLERVVLLFLALTAAAFVLTVLFAALRR